MKKFIGIILILISTFNINAGSYASYLTILNPAGKTVSQIAQAKQDAIALLLSNDIDQKNTVIVDLLVRKVLGLPYQELIKLDLATKVSRLLEALSKLTDALSSPSSTPDATSTNLVDLEGLLMQLLLSPLGHKLTYPELLTMSLSEKEKLVRDLTSPNPTGSADGAGAGVSTGVSKGSGAGKGSSSAAPSLSVSPVTPATTAPKPTMTPTPPPSIPAVGGTAPKPSLLAGITGHKDVAGLKKTGNAAATVPDTGVATGTGTGASAGAGGPPPTHSPSALQPHVSTTFGAPSTPAAGAGVGEPPSLEEREKIYFDAFDVASPSAINDLAYYERLQNDHTAPEAETNRKIIAALFAPRRVTRQVIENRAGTTPDAGISNEAILDFLLKDRFNQNPETVRQMILQDKQIGVVRFLLPYELRRRRILPKIGTGDIGYVEYPSPIDAIHGVKNMMVRGKALTNSYRHLDFKPENGTIYLINRHRFDSLRNDYHVIIKDGGFAVTYNNISNFYWAPDGETFDLVYQEGGKSGTYKGVDGSLVGELREPIVIEAPKASETTATTTGLNKKGQAVQIEGETEIHFNARLRAKLNEFEAKSITTRDPAVIRAMAILTLDKSFTGLKDDDIKQLTDISEDAADLAKAITKILAKDQDALNLLDQAILYYAIKTKKMPEDNPVFTKWNDTFNAMDAATLAGQNTQGTSGIPADAITDPSQLASFITEAIIRYHPSDLEKEQLRRPVSYTSKAAIAELIAKNPTSASDLEKAKAYFLIKANIIKSSDPKVVEWRSVLNI